MGSPEPGPVNSQSIEHAQWVIKDVGNGKPLKDLSPQERMEIMRSMSPEAYEHMENVESDTEIRYSDYTS